LSGGLAAWKANETFHPDGSMKDDKQCGQVEGVGKAVAALLAKLT
jgi:hypothetical protein